MSVRKLLLVLAAGLGIASAFAQAAIGTVTEVTGLATATLGASGMTVTQGLIVQNGMRFVTTSSGTVTVRLNSGCVVVVPPSHGVTITQTMTCRDVTAAVLPVVPVGAAAGVGVGAGLGAGITPLVVQGFIIGGAIGAAAAGFNQVINNNDEPLSAR